MALDCQETGKMVHCSGPDRRAGRLYALLGTREVKEKTRHIHRAGRVYLILWGGGTPSVK